jgi:hypothetical protein
MKFLFCRRGADGRTADAGAGGGGNSVLTGASLLARGRGGGEEPHTQPLTPTPAPTTEVRGYRWAMELGFLNHIRKSCGFGILRGPDPGLFCTGNFPASDLHSGTLQYKFTMTSIREKNFQLLHFT